MFQTGNSRIERNAERIDQAKIIVETVEGSLFQPSVTGK